MSHLINQLTFNSDKHSACPGLHSMSVLTIKRGLGEDKETKCSCYKKKRKEEDEGNDVKYVKRREDDGFNKQTGLHLNSLAAL